MTVRIDEHGCLIVGNCALPAAVVPAVEAFFRERFEHGGVVAEEPEWEYLPALPVGSAPKLKRTKAIPAGPWVPVKQEGAAT